MQFNGTKQVNKSSDPTKHWRFEISFHFHLFLITTIIPSNRLLSIHFVISFPPFSAPSILQMTAQLRRMSRPTSPDDFLLNEHESSYEFAALSFPQLLKQPPYTVDDSIYDLAIFSIPQTTSQNNPGLALNLSFPVSQHFHLPNVKEETQELEDYIQGLNDRFELPTENLLPITPRLSFDQGLHYYP